MHDTDISNSSSARSGAMIGLAIGAVAVGAFAIGALAIRRLAIRRLLVGSAELQSLRIDDLVVTRIHAGEIIASDSLTVPRTTDQ